MHAPHTLIVCVMLTAWPAAALAQSSLAEAAKQAEEQRQQNAGRSPLFTDRDLNKNSSDPELRVTKLSLERIERYSKAHADIMRALLDDHELEARVAQNSLENLHDYEQLLAGEPAFAERLARAGVTAHEYVYTQAAIAVVAELMKRGAQPSEVTAPAVSDNLRLVQAEASRIGKMLAEGAALQRQLLARAGITEAGKN